MRQKVRQLVRSSEGRRLSGNFLWLCLLQAANFIFPLITIPYLARVIGPEGFGKIAFAAAVVIWLQTISDWGFNYTAARDISRYRDDREKVSRIFSDVLWARLLLMTLSCLLLMTVVITVPVFREYLPVIFVSLLMLPGHILFPEWYFQAIEKMRYITIINVTAKALFVACVFLFIHTPQDYLLQPLFISLGYLASGVVAMWLIISVHGIRIYAPEWRKIVETLRRGFDVFINELMPNLYNSLSIVFLGVFSGSMATGFLDAGTKFVKIARQILDIVSRTFFPFLSRKLHYHYVFAKINIILALLFSLILFVFAPWIIRVFFTPEFSDSVIVLRILSVSLFFLALRNIYGTNRLIIEGRDREMRNISIVCSLVGFVIAIPLTYYYSYTGAALTIALTRILTGTACLLRGRKRSTDLVEA